MADDKNTAVPGSTNSVTDQPAPVGPPSITVVDDSTPTASQNSQEHQEKPRLGRKSYAPSKRKSVESSKTPKSRSGSLNGSETSFLARSNKVAPALLSATTHNRRQTSVASSLPLTSLPYKSPVLGGMAVAARKSVASMRDDDAKKKEVERRQSIGGAESSKDKEVFEMKMPRRSSIKDQRRASEPRTTTGTETYAQINPRTLGSLVQSLKVIYGDHFEDVVRRRHHRRRTHKSKEHSIEAEAPPKKPELTIDGAEVIHAHLYGSQTEIIEKFLENRRDCERELVFEEATFPRWVTYLWKVHLIYEFATSCILLISVFYGTYAAIFRDHSTDIELLGLMDFLIGIDVIIRLLVELWRSLTKCQYEVFTVNYTFGLALLDAIALFPSAFLYMYFADTNVLQNMMTIPRFELVQSCHMFRMVKILDKLQDDMNVRGYTKFCLFLVRYVIHYLWLVHLLACIIFFTGQKTYLQWLLNMQPESKELKQYVTFLTIRSHLPEPPEQFFLPYPEPFGIYSLSLYLVVATVSTVGFGDFFPTTNIERILIIIMMMIGAIWISGELAYKLGTFFTDQDSSRYMMFFRVNCIKIHLRNYHVSDFILKRTENYYKHLWRYRRGVHEIDLTYLPHCVQEEIKYDICEEMFYKSPMFRGLDETFLMGLAKDAKVSLFSPRMILFERGSITKKMCFILQGEVAVASDLSDDHISAIHRAGCLIGEINLFMSLPYEQTMYTRTVCTIMTITKRDLMLCLQDNPHIFSIMRERMRKRRERYRNAFQLQDVHPYVQWIYPKEEYKCDPNFPVSINNMKGWNKPVTGHPMEHIDEQVIIEMPCEREDLNRGVIEAYELITVPQIYYSPGLFLTAFNISTISLWFYLTWFTPVCATYDNFEDSYFGGCRAISARWDLIILACIIDFIIELITACPSTGRYYKLRDGLTVRKGSLGFYCDVLSLLPLEVTGYGWSISLIRMCLKFWKISRMWDFLDERFALRLFYIRIAKMTYYLLYLSYIVALFFLNLVCKPGRGKECAEISFYNPIYPQQRWERIKTGHHLEQYILSTPIVFAVSTITYVINITLNLVSFAILRLCCSNDIMHDFLLKMSRSVGFGNVVAQTTKEILWTTFYMIVGHFFVSYILAQLTSALSARLTPQLIFHQKLLVVETFIRHNGLSTNLLRRLVEHYDLQHQYVSGCALPEGTHLMYDGHSTLFEDVLLVEGEIFFDGVPAFAKIPSQAIIDMSRLMRRFVVPPDLVFVQRGEVRRELYVIVNGSVALYQHGEQSASAILRSTGHFGLRDLLFGEPYPYKVKTLSYVVLYSVDYAVFEEVLGDDEGLLEYIKDELKRREDEISNYRDSRIVDEDGPSEREVVSPSWLIYPGDPDAPAIGGDLTYDHFERPFLYHKGSDFIRRWTMPKVLHPAGQFGTVWQAIMGLAAVANFVFLVVETFMGHKGPKFRITQFLLDLLFCADIYIKCHWAYYDWSDGHLRYHPVKTWSRYLFKGTFFIEVAMMIPLELILAFSGSTDFFGYGPGHSWYTKLRWIRMLRFLKFIELYAIVHRIFENRTTVMFLFYLSITVLMSTLIGALAFFFACPTFGYTWTNGDEFRLPVCEENTWVHYKHQEQKNIRIRYKPLSSGTPIPALPVYTKELFHARSIWERWIYGLYYIGQVLMVIGFGDQATFRSTELHFLTSIALFGFIVCQSLSADITSAQVDTDEIRAINRENLNRLAIALSREGASPAFVKYIRSAFHLSYSYTRGLQPNDLFDDLYPVLHRDLFHEYVGDVLDRVPIFLGFNDAFLNMLKRKFRIEFIPKGGLVTRAGDLDFRMYIVVRGEMWVCDRNDRWLCTMMVGESVGEMSLVYSAKRRYSAYAATNLQVLVLKAEDFATVLELFPLLRKQILRSLLDYKRESYIIKAWKWNVRDHEGYQQEQKEKTETLKLFSQQNITRIHVEGYVKLTDKEQYIPEPGFWKTIVGYGFGDTFPHYIYFASDNEKFNPVIHPSSPFIGHFHSLKSIVSFFGPILAVYHVFFYVAGRDLSVTRYTIGLGIFIDAVLWIDILLKFFTAVEIVKRKTFCKNLKKIIIHYLCRPSGFIYDFIVAFPYDLATGNEGTKLMMLRCFLSIKYFSDLWKLQDDIGVSTLKFKLTTSISFLLYLAHILACIFFWISCPQSEDLNHCQLNGWVYTFRIQFGKLHSAPFPPGTTAKDFNDLYNDPNPSHWYIISLYWVMTVLTTVGFGDITPTNFEEITLAVFCIFFGSLFLSIMLGNITTGLSSLSKAKRNFLGKVEKMLDYLKIIGLSSVAHKTLSAYCNMTWNNCRGVNYNDIASILPLYVQQDVYLALYHNCVTHALFFGENYDLTFVRAICSRVRHYMFLPGMRIANELEPGTGIYIVMRGAVTSFQQNPSTGTYEFIKRYEKHQVFGRIPALFPGALYNKSYRAEDKTEVLLMYHADIRQLVTKFPKWKLFLKEIIAREYPHFATQSSLKDITERKFAMDERLTKKLTDEQFMEAADMFTSDPPERTGKYSENFEAKRTADNAKKTSDTVENNEDEDAKPTISRKTQRQSFSMGSKSNSRLSVSIIAARGRMSRRPAKSFHKFSDARSYKS